MFRLNRLLLMFLLSVCTLYTDASVNDVDPIAVIGKILNCYPEEVSEAGNAAVNSVPVKDFVLEMKVRKVLQGQKPRSRKLKVTFTLPYSDGMPAIASYRNVLCFITPDGNGGYRLLDTPRPNEVYRTVAGKWIAPAISRLNMGFFRDTFAKHGRRVHIAGKPIDSNDLLGLIETCVVTYDCDRSLLEEYYIFRGDRAKPRYGIDVMTLLAAIRADHPLRYEMTTPYYAVAPHPVDLGLSVLWGDCNLGASSPGQAGGYYSWGETEVKERYSPDNYKWSDVTAKTLTKYYVPPVERVSGSKLPGQGKDGIVTGEVELYQPILPVSGPVDGKSVLETPDDAAAANLGAGWRTPTEAEFQELIDNCTWTRTEFNGTDGFNIRSNLNGKEIFLPMSGCVSFGQTVIGLGDNSIHQGFYMSSSLSREHPDMAMVMKISGVYSGLSASNRCDGLTIRPVHDR